MNRDVMNMNFTTGNCIIIYIYSYNHTVYTIHHVVSYCIIMYVCCDMASIFSVDSKDIRPCKEKALTERAFQKCRPWKWSWYTLGGYHGCINHCLSWFIMVYHISVYIIEYCILLIHVYRLVHLLVMISRCIKSYSMYRFQWYQASEVVGSLSFTGLHLTL